ncbi:E3 ubiquitin-protein ligase TRIM69-like [Festucalex cinctus]
MASKVEEHLQCPTCLDIFKDPVMLLCGHSFCRVCVQTWWQEKGQQSCPVCRKRCKLMDPPSNLSLKNMCEALSPPSVASEDMCSLHNEKLNVFCLDHLELMCLICTDTQLHDGHKFSPVNEVVKVHKEKLQEGLQQAKRRLDDFQDIRDDCNEQLEYIKVQLQRVQRKIKKDFAQFRRFLRVNEECRLNGVSMNELSNIEKMNDEIGALDRDMAALSDAIRSAEEQLNSDPLSFMKNFKTPMTRIQKLPDTTNRLTGALLDEVYYVGNLRFRVWNELKKMVSYSPVILDPNTATEGINLCEDLTSMCAAKLQQCPQNPERGHDDEVLGAALGDNGEVPAVVKLVNVGSSLTESVSSQGPWLATLKSISNVQLLLSRMCADVFGGERTIVSSLSKKKCCYGRYIAGVGLHNRQRRSGLHSKRKDGVLNGSLISAVRLIKQTDTDMYQYVKYRPRLSARPIIGRSLMCEALSPPSVASEDMCSLHNEKLNVFCLDHLEVVCLICMDTQRHDGHKFSPVDKVVNDHKKKLQEGLQQAKKRLKSFQHKRDDCSIQSGYLKVQGQRVQRKIKKDFALFRRYLRLNEVSKLTNMRGEAVSKIESLNDKIRALYRDMAALSDAIRSTEEQLNSDPVSFMKNFNTAMTRIQNLPDMTNGLTGALLDEAFHVGNLKFWVWEQMKTMISYSPVLLDQRCQT